MGAGILNWVFGDVGRVSHLFHVGFSQFFLSFFSSSNLQQKLQTRKKKIHFRTWEEFKSILVLGKVTALGARWTQQKTQWVKWFSA